MHLLLVSGFRFYGSKENNISQGRIISYPFEKIKKNFIYQIISNEKAKISIKINYLLILTLLYENENIDNIMLNTLAMLILLKAIVAFAVGNYNLSLKETEALSEFLSTYGKKQV